MIEKMLKRELGDLKQLLEEQPFIGNTMKIVKLYSKNVR